MLLFDSMSLNVEVWSFSNALNPEETSTLACVLEIWVTGGIHQMQETWQVWNENLFLKKIETRFAVESTSIESVTYPYKTALSEANVKTNRMGSTKWTCHKERSFASIYFIFLKILFQYKNLL